MKLYVNEYLSQFPGIFGRCNELYSVHALLHLCEQCYSFWGLAFHSMFALESALYHYLKLAYGSVLCGSQIAYRHRINQPIETIGASKSTNLFYQDYFLDDDLVYSDLCLKYKHDFRDVFPNKFKEEVPAKLRIFSRYQCGLMLYRALVYSAKHCFASYCVSVKNSECIFSRCFGHIVLFFEFRKQKLFFFEQLLCISRPFSFFISKTNRINSWNDRINSFFSLVNSVTSSLCIVSCDLLNHKTIFAPFQNEVFACTEIQHELEHD